MPKWVRNSSCASRSGDRSLPYAMSITLITGIVVLLCDCVGRGLVEPFLCLWPGRSYGTRGNRPLPHSACRTLLTILRPAVCVQPQQKQHGIACRLFFISA